MVIVLLLILFFPAFKFQYGATNILTTATNAFAEEAFKFQYGATNMSQLLLLLLPLTFI